LVYCGVSVHCVFEPKSKAEERERKKEIICTHGAAQLFPLISVQSTQAKVGSEIRKSAEKDRGKKLLKRMHKHTLFSVLCLFPPAPSEKNDKHRILVRRDVKHNRMNNKQREKRDLSMRESLNVPPARSKTPIHEFPRTSNASLNVYI
jgi:hypothetical protein